MRYLILLVLLTVALCSCNENDSLIQPSALNIEMEGEGGEVLISFSGAAWEIDKVINNRGNVSMYGNIYSEDGKIMDENKVLRLKSIGAIETVGAHNGFKIERPNNNALKVILKENSLGEEFRFSIVLKAGDEEKMIQVSQKKSEGYTFKDILYGIEAGDGDSIYVKKSTTYKFDIAVSQKIELNPISGRNAFKRSFFSSEDKNAFCWLPSKLIKVLKPSVIDNEKVYMGEEGVYYSSATNEANSEYTQQKEEVTIPAGKTEFAFNLEYRRRKVTYSLVLENNRTKQEKLVKGKWIEFAPTGKYTVVWK
ncbi:hypothetical protein EMN47_17255 [Prolixibacteraceae bacterium JC049]|nr:hypothetical protein [Prolixibacteraceae bacterium JC049]